MQVVKLVDSEYVNENMVQNSRPTCKNNLFKLIQSKKFLVFGFGHVGIREGNRSLEFQGSLKLTLKFKVNSRSRWPFSKISRIFKVEGKPKISRENLS